MASFHPETHIAGFRTPKSMLFINELLSMRLGPTAKLLIHLMPIVELQQVRKVYDTKIAVDDLSFTIEPGTMFGLLGPNGSGKTSSIRMMIGITVPDSRTDKLVGQPV